MATNISTQLKNELLSAEISFISSIQSDQNAVANFSVFWDNLNMRIEEAATSQLLDDETCAAAQSVAAQISALAESFLEIRLAEDDILTRHNHEIDEILLDAQDVSEVDDSRLAVPPVPRSITSQISRSRTHSTPTAGSNRQSKALSGWLLKHVHNPYPSQNRKLQLARSVDVSMKAVNNWFSTTRRQIGWTAFCKRHFKGNRQLAVDCAHQILNQDATSFSSDVVWELLEVKSRAEKIFGQVETRNTSLELLHSLDQESLKRRSSCIEENRRNKRRCVSSISDSDQTGPVFDLSESIRFSRKARSVSTETTGDICGNVSHLCNEEKLSPCQDLRYVTRFDGKLLSDKSSGRSKSRSTTSASRTASVSSTDSSRETTEELPTPVIPTYDFLPDIVDSCIDSWISSVATETQVCVLKDTGFRESRKRSICETNFSTWPKRRRTDSEVLPTRAASELLSTPCQQRVDWLDLLPQFDFELPPPVSFTSNITDGEVLHLRVFDCEDWKQSTDPSLYAAGECNFCLLPVHTIDYVLRWILGYFIVLRICHRLGDEG